MSEVIEITKALADNNRLRIVYGINKYKEMCVCQIASYLGIAEATVSRHMSILQKADIIESYKMSRWVCYTISPNFEKIILNWICEQFKPDNEDILDKVMSETLEEFEKVKAEYKKRRL